MILIILEAQAKLRANDNNPAMIRQKYLWRWIETSSDFLSEQDATRGISNLPKKEGSDRPARSRRLAIMRVHSALQRVFPHGQLRKTAAIDLRAGVMVEGTITWGIRFSRACYKFIRRVRIYSFCQPGRLVGRSISWLVVRPVGRTDERTNGRTDGRLVGGWSIALADARIFAILQYRRPEWVKLASPCHLRAYGNICKNSKSNWSAGAFDVAAVRYRLQNRTIASCQLARFTRRYVRHEPVDFHIFFL